MEIPTRHRNPPGVLPPIFVGDSNSRPSSRSDFGSSARPFPSYGSALGTSGPMSIKSSQSFGHDAPPPLPPPRIVPVDGPVAEHGVYPEPNVLHNPSDSGYGSFHSRIKREMDFGRPDRDEGFGSMSYRSQNSIPARFGRHHEAFQFNAASNSFDNEQLNKLNSYRSLNNRSPPHRPSIASSIDSFGPRPMAAERMPLKPLSVPTSLPTRTKNQGSMLESPTRFTETPMSSNLSPRSTPFGGHDSVSSLGDRERSPMSSRAARTDSGSLPDDAATVSSYEMSVDENDSEETQRLRGFHLDEQARDGFFHTTGLKRRASSPPGDDHSSNATLTGMPPSTNDILRRREAGASRGSPTPRLSTMPQGSSMSARGGASSYISNLSLAASSLSNMGSFNAGRRSPGGLSPGGSGLSPTEPSSGSPFGTPMSVTASPRSSISSRTPHIRTHSEQTRQQPVMSPRKLSDYSKPVVPNMTGFLMCECCPKKPKKFESREELEAHAAEKQYECNFCHNRFKNKNEAERHQNSLHVRKYSWSCCALSGWDRAFHESTNQPGRMDTCGYCGKEFARSGPPSSRTSPGAGSSAGSWEATDQDWEERIRHLTDEHKFRECNSSKKFYRADHFRQHLKHSHHGTSGKWTNMLENACMQELPPPAGPMSGIAMGMSQT